MGILETFKELVKFVAFIPNLVKINQEARQRIRDAVGTVADELIRGLSLVESRIAGGKVLARSHENGANASLQAYMAETNGKLYDAFAEFKICRGLREIRDDFARPFAVARAAVKIGNINKIDELLSLLEQDERLIGNEVGPLIHNLTEAAARSNADFLKTADEALLLIAKRRARLRRLARQVHDKL